MSDDISHVFCRMGIVHGRLLQGVRLVVATLVLLLSAVGVYSTGMECLGQKTIPVNGLERIVEKVVILDHIE